MSKKASSQTARPQAEAVRFLVNDKKPKSAAEEKVVPIATTPDPVEPAKELASEPPKKAAKKPAASKPKAAPKPQPAHAVVRVQYHTRVTSEIKRKVKDACYERERDGIEPCSIQDITEEALELWFSKNGY